MSSELTRMTAAELSAALSKGEVSATEVTRAHLDRIAAVDDRVHAFLHVAADKALAQAGEIDAERRQGTIRSPLAGVPVAVKDVFTTTGMPTTCGSRILEGWHPPYDATDHAAAQAGRRDHSRQDQHGRVRHGLVHRELRVRAQPQPVGPGQDPGRLVRRVRGRGGGLRGAAGHRHRHRRLDPPARRGLRHRRHQADLRRLVPVRRGRVREQPGHARAVRPDRARHGAAARGDVRARPVRLHLDRRAGAAGGGRGPRGRRERHADRRGHRAERRGLPAGRPGQVRRGGRAARVAGRQGHRGVLPALQVRAARLLPDRAQRVLVQPGPVRRHALRAAGRRRRDPGRRRGHGADPRGRVRRRGQAAHHPGHLRAVQRLLRRLLRQGPAGPHADHQGLRRGLRPGRRAGLAVHADHGVRHRRAGRRPDGHVPGRPGHDPVGPGRQRGDLGAVRAGPRGRPAGRAAGDGARAGRRPAVPGRRRRRGGLHRALGPSAAGRGEGSCNT